MAPRASSSSPESAAISRPCRAFRPMESASPTRQTARSTPRTASAARSWRAACGGAGAGPRAAPGEAPTAESLRPASLTRLGLDHELREARLAQVRLLDRPHQLGDLLDVRLERIVADHADVQQVAEPDVRPVEVVLDRVLARELDELATHAGPRVGRRLGLGLLHLLVLEHALDLTVLLHQIVEPAVHADVVVLEVEHEDARVVPGRVARVDVGLDQPALDHPVDLAVEAVRISV